jgi:hypothetical protein
MLYSGIINLYLVKVYIRSPCETFSCGDERAAMKSGDD